MTTIDSITPFFFDFYAPGGPNNLLPGGPHEQSQSMNRPRGSGFIVSLSGFTGAFVTDGGRTISNRPLGQFTIRTGIRGFNELVCWVRLTDDNMDDEVRIQAWGTVTFFSNP